MVQERERVVLMAASLIPIKPQDVRELTLGSHNEEQGQGMRTQMKVGG